MASKLKTIALQLSLTSGTAEAGDLLYVGHQGGDVDAAITFTELAAFVAAVVVGGGATAEIIRDTIGTALLQAAGITIAVNDGADTITLSVDTEAIQDIIGALIGAATGANSGIVVTYNDAGNVESIGLASSTFQALTDQANIDWDMAVLVGFNAKVTLGGNRTLNTPTNAIEGRTYTLKITQDGTGSRTLTWPAAISFGTAGNPTLSTGAGKIDLVYLQCLESAGPTFRATFNKAA